MNQTVVSRNPTWFVAVIGRCLVNGAGGFRKRKGGVMIKAVKCCVGELDFIPACAMEFLCWAIHLNETFPRWSIVCSSFSGRSNCYPRVSLAKLGICPNCSWQLIISWEEQTWRMPSFAIKVRMTRTGLKKRDYAGQNGTCSHPTSVGLCQLTQAAGL